MVQATPIKTPSEIEDWSDEYFYWSNYLQSNAPQNVRKNRSKPFAPIHG